MQTESGMRPPLTRDLFIQTLADPIFSTGTSFDQMEIVFDYIALYWHLSIDQLKEKEFDLEECYTLLYQQLEEAYEFQDNLRISELNNIQYQLTSYFTRSLDKFDDAYFGNESFSRLAQFVLEKKAAVLSFNYDTLLEGAIESASGLNKKSNLMHSNDGPLSDEDLVDSHFEWNRPCAYGVKFDDVQLHRAGTSDIAEGEDFYRVNELYSSPLLKLHGSLNWFIYSGNMVVEGAETLRNPARKGKTTVRKHHYNNHLPPHDNLEYLAPLIITPVLNKPDLRHPLIFHVWELARRELSNCQRLVIIGYSFPPTDFHIRRLFREMFAHYSIDELVVVNPDSRVSHLAKDLCNFQKPVIVCDNLDEFHQLDF